MKQKHSPPEFVVELFDQTALKTGSPVSRLILPQSEIIDIVVYFHGCFFNQSLSVLMSPVLVGFVSG